MWLLGGHVWLPGGVHGKGGMHGKGGGRGEGGMCAWQRGACMVKGGHA